GLCSRPLTRFFNAPASEFMDSSPVGYRTCVRRRASLYVMSHRIDAPTPQRCDQSMPIVLVVDDDEQIRSALGGLVRSAGYRVALYADAIELLANPLPDGVRCLVADVRLPIVSGLDLQRELAKRGEHVPVLFITGHGDIPMSVRAMKAGAVDFLS